MLETVPHDTHRPRAPAEPREGPGDGREIAGAERERAEGGAEKHSGQWHSIQRERSARDRADRPPELDCGTGSNPRRVAKLGQRRDARPAAEASETARATRVVDCEA
jgi:hypothetical protein